MDLGIGAHSIWLKFIGRKLHHLLHWQIVLQSLRYPLNSHRIPDLEKQKLQ